MREALGEIEVLLFDLLTTPLMTPGGRG